MARSTELVELYVDSLGQHQWRYVASNGTVLAGSNHGYSNRVDALNRAGQVCGFDPADVGYYVGTRQMYGYIERPQRARDLEVVTR